jgi:hypothetical protein
MSDMNSWKENSSEPVPTEVFTPLSEAEVSKNWLTVSEAVIYCELSGLPRTPKTIRKWAHRSYDDAENGELSVRREDVDNGFRWTIERTSLDRKIEQELEFEARRLKAPNEPVSTIPDRTEPVRTSNNEEKSAVPEDDLAKNPSEPEFTGAHRFEQGRSSNEVILQLEARIDDLKSEVEFYRDELRDRRQTTLALTDVIEAFRLTAASNASRARERSERSDRRAHDIRTREAAEDPDHSEQSNLEIHSVTNPSVGDKWSSGDEEFGI